MNLRLQFSPFFTILKPVKSNQKCYLSTFNNIFCNLLFISQCEDKSPTLDLFIVLFMPLVASSETHRKSTQFKRAHALGQLHLMPEDNEISVQLSTPAT